MIIKDHTRIDLATGGTRFKQGDFVELAFTPRDAAGKVVDLTGKDIEVSIWNRSKGVIYQGAASFDSAEKLIRVTIKETLDHGKFQIEFTVTDSTDADYRRKFPSDEYNGVINITPSTDNMDVVGVQMTTVTQLKGEFQTLQNEFAGQVLPRVDTVESKQTQLEADYQAAAGALTEDSEVILARKGEPTLRAFNDKITTQLAETEAEAKRKRALEDLTPEVLAAIEGGGGTSFNLLSIPQDNSVTPTKTNFFDISRNLYDDANALTDTSISSAGEIITEAGRKLSGYIKVSPGETIANGGAVFRISYHRADQSFITRTGSPLADNFQVTNDPEVAYMRISPPTSISAGLMVNRGATPLPFEAYYERVKPTYLPDTLNETEVNDLINTKVDPKIANELAPVNTKVTELENSLANFESKPHYLKVHADGDFTVYMNIGKDEFASTRFKRDTVENFIKMYEQSIQTFTGGAQDVTSESNYDSVSNSSMLATTTNNHYTTTVGTVVTETFTGKDITGRFYRRYDGGMWKVSIDSTFVKNVSVKKNDTASGETFEEVLATGLANIEHTVELEFIGNDPENPATTSDGVTPTTPRGWIHHDTTGDTTKTTFKTVARVENAVSFAKKFDLTQGFSNKEYAFEVAVDAQSTAEWFPAHSGIGTTNTGATGRQVLTADGVEVSLLQASDFIRFNKVNFIQIMESKLSTDTQTRANLKLVMTAEGNKVREYLDMTFLLETYMRNGYVFQMPLLNEYVSRIKTGAHEVVNADTVNLGTNSYFQTKAVDEYIATSDFSNKENYYMKVGITKQSDEFTDLYLQHRSDGIMQKLYPKPYSQEVMPVGRVIHWEGYYEVDRLQNANLIYS